ncbi:hypothetical protein E4P41_07615 [Geodermatophilus sp. DF01-2]|uniref:O-antigen ligase family protein n=1 Tax=Geodermatophilus sp. DF01-2 TaxID=2559610 RepID=UPI001073BFD4|nr:O-antigen ligase family protein [Geodermatophilus sp. DF01_2]TFV62350.1 hypothetical protein E4P41_07615 [Geodermatophilus sp. DF01_2]
MTAPAFLLVAVAVGVLLALLAWRALHRPAFAVCCLVAAIPLGGFVVVGFTLIHLVSVAVSAGGALAAVAGAGRALRPSAVLLAAAGLVAVSLLSVLTAVDPGASLRMAVIHVIGLGLAWAAARACPSRTDVRLVLTVLTAVGGGVSLFALGTTGDLTAAHGGNVVVGRATGVFSQPNELGLFCGIVLVVGLATATVHRSFGLRALCWVSSAAAAAALAVSLSRGAWIGTVLGCLVLLVVVPAVRRLLTAAAGLALAGLVVAMVLPTTGSLGVLTARLRSLVEPSNPYDDRPLIWAEAIRQVADAPLLGVGSGGFSHAAVADASPLRSEPATHAHSMVLGVSSEMGLLGLAAFLVLLVVAVATSVASVKRLGAQGPTGSGLRAMTGAVVAALGVVLGQGLIDLPLANPLTQTTLWLLVGLLAAIVEMARRPLPGDSSSAVPPEHPTPFRVGGPAKTVSARQRHVNSGAVTSTNRWTSLGDLLTSWVVRVPVRPPVFLLAAVIVVLGALGRLEDGNSALALFDLDGEGKPPAVFAAALLGSTGVGCVLAGRAGLPWRRRWSILGAFLVFMAFDEALTLHETLSRLTGVPWTVLYAPIVAFGGIAWVLVLRDVWAEQRIRYLWLLGALAWATSQVLEELQSSPEQGRAPGYDVYVLFEECLEMTGSLCWLLAIVLVVRLRSGGHGGVGPAERSSGRRMTPVRTGVR